MLQDQTYGKHCQVPEEEPNRTREIEVSGSPVRTQDEEPNRSRVLEVRWSSVGKPQEMIAPDRMACDHEKSD